MKFNPALEKKSHKVILKFFFYNTGCCNSCNPISNNKLCNRWMYHKKEWGSCFFSFTLAWFELCPKASAPVPADVQVTAR